MKKVFLASLFFCLLINLHVYSQTAAFNKVKFFEDTSIVNATITTDVTHLFRQRTKAKQFEGHFAATLPGIDSVNVPVTLELRGHMRKDYCNIPPVRMHFKGDKKSVLSSMGTLKLVNECIASPTDEQYLIKEFLIYKMYNMITDMSFRVRLLKVNFVDSAKKKTITEYAFLVEDVKDLAKRNNCKELKTTIKLNELQTDHTQTTTVAIFEYMIGNTDWGVGANHNTRLMEPKMDSTARPYIVPYDFDYAGLVNTDYAEPDENLGIENVRERLYRGFPRSMQEMNDALDVFKKQKDNIYTLINTSGLLTKSSKKDMIYYLDDFFKTINDQGAVKSTFINNARSE